MNVFDTIAAAFLDGGTWVKQRGYSLYNIPLLEPIGTVFVELGDWLWERDADFRAVSTWYKSVSAAIASAVTGNNIVNIIREYWADLYNVAVWFLSWAASVRTVINTWWETGQVWVTAEITKVKIALAPLITAVSTRVDGIEEYMTWLSVDFFPGLVTFEGFGDAIVEWFQTNLDWLQDTIEASTSGLADVVRSIQDKIELLTGVDDAALDWLRERIERMLERLW